MDIKIPVEFPAIDLSTLLPLAALVILAALILVTLTARSIIKSRAFGLGLLALIIIAGSATIVGSLQAIAIVIGVAGVVAIGGVVVLGRNPDVLDLLHVVARRETPAQLPPADWEQPQALIDAPRQFALPAPRRAKTQPVGRAPKDWGF